MVPLLFSMYINDQPLLDGCSRFIYVGDQARSTQQHDFPEAESTPETGLSDMLAYYLENHLRPNTGKTHIFSFHLKKRAAKVEVNINGEA